MTSQVPCLPRDSGTNALETKLSPLVKILWPLNIIVLCPLGHLIFIGIQCLGNKISLWDPRMRWWSSLNHLAWSWEPRGLGPGWDPWLLQSTIIRGMTAAEGLRGPPSWEAPWF